MTGAVQESPVARAAHTYAVAVMSVQAMMADVQAGRYEPSARIKRVAQTIVAHAEADTRLLVALAAVSGSRDDPAVAAVSSAVLTVAMAKQLSTDRALLANAAMAAMVFDLGRLQVAAAGALDDDVLDRMPASSVAILSAMATLDTPARIRSVLVYEMWSETRAHRIGPPYQGRRTATLLSRMVGIARAFAELRAARSNAPGASGIDDSILALMKRAEDATERALMQLLVGALGSVQRDEEPAPAPSRRDAAPVARPSAAVAAVLSARPPASRRSIPSLPRNDESSPPPPMEDVVVRPKMPPSSRSIPAAKISKAPPTSGDAAPLSRRDDLLAAFLSDAPIAEPEPPGPVDALDELEELGPADPLEIEPPPPRKA